MRTPSPHRKSGRHSKGSRNQRITEQHHDDLIRQVKRLEKELRVKDGVKR
jgi:hypothetical protein